VCQLTVDIAIDVDALRPGFTHLCFRRPGARGEDLFYYLAWQPTLLDGWAVVRIYGPPQRAQKHLPPLSFPSLDAAWPCLRCIIRRRLREGYAIIDPPPHGAPW